MILSIIKKVLRISSILLLSTVLLISCSGGSGGGESGGGDNSNNNVADTTPPVITLNGANIILNQGTAYIEAGASAVDDIDGNVAVIITGAVNIDTVGNYIITYTATDLANNSSSITRTVSIVIPDIEAPVIILNGNNTISISLNTPYIELGANATDNIDANVTVVITGAVNTAVLGSYIITYTATDVANNSVFITRTVNVVIADINAPVITLNGNSSVRIVQNTAYTELGATAIDDRDGSVNVVISGAVDITTVGIYIINYTATDLANNSSTVTRTVNVVLPDTEAPIISLIGQSSITIDINTPYTELGATANDVFDGPVNVVITGTVNVTIADTYIITYTATDAATNSNSITRTVIVEIPDNTDPIVTLIGDSAMVLFLNDSYIELGATATDDIDGVLTVSISGVVDTGTEGIYILTYSATDAAGNIGSIIRTITVTSDNEAPVVTVIGELNIVLYQGDSYTESGASALDNRDGVVAVIVSGVVDTTVAGVYIITYTATDAATLIGTATRTVNVLSDQFITTWKTDNAGTSDDNQILIGTNGGGYNYTVDWGDGLSDTNVTGSITHTYATAGTYSIAINGVFPRLYFTTFGYDNKKLLSVDQWGKNKWASLRNTFYNCSNVVGNALDTPDLSQATDMSQMFYNATIFNQDIGDWDVSTITNMDSTFYNARNFNQDLSSWNVTSVTDMQALFFGARQFNQPLSTWDVSNVTNMRAMFLSAIDFNQDISNWNVANVTNMASMFVNLSFFNFDLSAWDVSKVTRMTYMFSGATRFNQDISSWNVASVTLFNNMFQNAKAFNQNIGIWDVSQATDMSFMFYAATVFNQDISSWNVSLVNSFSNMFFNANAFNQNINVWNVASANDMSFMFRGSKVFDQALDTWNVSAVTNMASMFSGALVFNQDLSPWDVALVSNMSSMFSGSALFNQDLSAWNVSSVTNMANMFGSGIFNQDITTWDVSKVTDMSGMFNGNSVFNQNISNWTVAAVTNMSSIFQDASTFNQNIGVWNVSAVSNMSSMFSGASAFNQDITAWTVLNVTDMSSMFGDAIAFNQDISNWNVSMVTLMSGLFSGAASFDQDISLWNVSNVTNMSSMFNRASVFNQDLSLWDVSSVTDMSSQFAEASAFNQSLAAWDITAVTTMQGMFTGITLTVPNYDATLIAWSLLGVQNNVPFDGGNSLYSSTTQASRDVLTASYAWIITDGGVAPGL